MILRDIFSRSQRGLLYRFMDMSRAEKVVSNNFLPCTKMTAAPNLSKMWKSQNLGLRERVSFTRNKNFHEAGERGIGSMEVRFALDGDRLSDTYKIFPYDDYPEVGSLWDKEGNNRKHARENMESHLSDMSIYDEDEEVLVLKPGERGIKGVLSYIVGIDLLDSPSTELKKFRELVNEAGFPGIKVGVVNSF